MTTPPVSPSMSQIVRYVRKQDDGTTTTVDATVVARSEHSPIIDVEVKQKGQTPFRAYLIRADHTKEPHPGTWHYPEKGTER
jgi:hypothetical protein